MADVQSSPSLQDLHQPIEQPDTKSGSGHGCAQHPATAHLLDPLVFVNDHFRLFLTAIHRLLLVKQFRILALDDLDPLTKTPVLLLASGLGLEQNFQPALDLADRLTEIIRNGITS